VRPGRVAALVGWAVLAVAVAAELAVVEVLWLPLRVGGVLVPVSVVAAVLGNLLLAPAARWLSRSRVVGVLPPLVWVVVALAASQRRPEGDLLIIGGGATGQVNLAFLLLGMLAAVFAVGRVLGGRVLGVRRRPAARVRDDDVQAGASR
jgi:hypothetical protein